MFIVNLTYKKSSSEVEPLREGHMEFVRKQFENGVFLASGRKSSLDGGVILCSAENRQALDEILSTDPFVIKDVVELEIVEFSATSAIRELEYLKGK